MLQSLQKSMNAVIFKLLGIDGEFDEKALFSMKNIDNQDLSIKRLQFIMQIYSASHVISLSLMLIL